MIQVGNKYLFVCKHFDDMSEEDLISIAKNNNLPCEVLKYVKPGDHGQMYEVRGGYASCEMKLFAFEDELIPLQ